MQMTFDSYIENPSGLKNGVWTYRSMYKDMYNQKLTKILVRETGKVNYKLYHDNDVFFIHFKIPSEKIHKFYYDTVIMFYTDDPHVKNNNNIRKYNVKFYSNDPAFVFTFAHSFIKNDIFIKDLISKMSKQAVKKAAVETNPKNEVGYVKSIYFSYILMDRYNLWSKSTFTTYGEKFNKSKILSEIEEADIKIDERTRKENEYKKKDKIEKNKQKNKITENPKNVKTVKDVSKFNKSKTVNNIINTKKTKSVNFKKK